MASHTSTRSTTRAKVLTAVTVAAAGVAAYMAGSLSNDLLQNPLGSSSITRSDERRSCVMACEYNGGVPCAASVDATSEAACRARVESCQLSCPLPDLHTVLLRGNASVATLPVAQLGMDYRKQLVLLPLETVEGGIWEVTKGALPPGMNIDPTSGLLYGTPSQADTYAFSLTRSVVTEKQAAPVRVTARVQLVVENQRVPVAAVGANPDTASASISTSAPSAIDVTTPIGEVYLSRGQNFDVQLQVFGIPAAEQRWSIAFGRLPEGLTLSPSGRISGASQEKAGTYRFGVMVTSNIHESAGIRAYENGTIILTDVAAASGSAAAVPESDANTAMSPASLPVARVNEAYSVPLSVNDAYPRTWSIEGLPQGLSFNADSRVISGTPREDGIFTVRVTSRRSSGLTFTQKYTLTVNRAGATDADRAAAANQGSAVAGLTIDVNVPEAIADRAYSAQLRAISSYASIRWSFPAGKAVPSGWTLSEAGVLAHPKPIVGVVTLPVSVRSYDGAATQQENIVINVRPMTVAEAAASGSTSASQPSAADSAKTAAESAASAASAASALAFANVSSYPDGTVGVAYSSRPFQVTGGKEGYVYTISSGTRPPGLALSDTGALQGAPTTAGTYNFTMRVTDATGAVIQASRTVRINAAPVASGSGSGSGSSSSGQTVSGGGGGGGGGGAIGSVSLPNSDSAALQTRMNTLNRIGIQVHDLVKLQDDGDANTQHDTTVYYIGSDGRRHFFPNPKVYFTWFHDFSRVRIVSAASLAEIPLGANVTYRPGVRMVKFESDNKVYAIEGGRRLRWIQSEADAASIYGVNWNRNIDDIPVVFYTDYVFGTALGSAASFSPSITMAMITWPSQVLP